MSESDNIYINVSINHDDAYLQTPSPARYKITQTVPIIYNPSNYYCSIIRFDIPLLDVPLYIFPILPNSGTSQTSPLVIGITYNGIDYPVNLIYVADNSYSPVNQTNQNKQIITPYYFVYDYQNMINSINTALSTAISKAGITGVTIYFYIVPNEQLLYLSLNGVTALKSSGATIFINEYLYNYLAGFEFTFINYESLTHNYNLKITYPPSSVTIPDPYNIPQQYNNFMYWNSLKKILITSNSLPIQNEFIDSSNTNGETIGLPIITDFTPTFEFPGQTRSIAYYYPQSQYRLVDMKSNSPITSLDLNIYWEDKHNNVYPLCLDNYSQVNIKLGFFNKNLYKNR